MTPAELLPPAASVRGAVLRASVATLIVLLLLACMPEAVEEPAAEPPATETSAVPDAPAEAPVVDAAEVVAVEAADATDADAVTLEDPAPVGAVAEAPEATPASPVEPPAVPAESVEAPPPVPAERAEKPAAQVPDAPETPLVLQPPPHPQTVVTHPVVPVRPPGQEDLPLTVAQADPPPAPAKPVPKQAPKPASKPAATPAPKPAAEPSFRLQLGGYRPRAEARELHEAARGAGYPTRLLHRVVVGPYATRAAALAAQKQITTKTILIRGASDAEWWLQAGVFSDARNAESLHATLAAVSVPVAVQARVLAGPYADRAAAEQVLNALRAALQRSLADAEIVAVR